MSDKRKVESTYPASVKSDPVFEISTLRKDSIKLFGVTTSTFDGAMSGQTEPLTIKAASDIIELWKKGVAK